MTQIKELIISVILCTIISISEEFNHLSVEDSSILTYWMSPFVIKGVFWLCLFFYLFYCFFLMKSSFVSYAKSVDPDQMPQHAASDQGLHCLLVSLLLTTSH